jgi:hypothetical protein
MANLYPILPLTEVKRYLRLDDDLNDDDLDLERMISSALEYITKQTNHVFRPQDITYYSNPDYNGCDTICVFDYPVNTLNFGEKIPLRYSGYIKFLNTQSITVNVGYTTRAQVPTALIECALQMIKVWYYESEKNVNTTLLPENVNQIINTYRRFIAI